MAGRSSVGTTYPFLTGVTTICVRLSMHIPCRRERMPTTHATTDNRDLFRALAQLIAGQAQGHEMLGVILKLLTPDEKGDNRVAVLLQELVDLVAAQTEAIQANTEQSRATQAAVEALTRSATARVAP